LDSYTVEVADGQGYSKCRECAGYAWVLEDAAEGREIDPADYVPES
jgi:hypothetical protein